MALRQQALIHPYVDFLMIGGFSIFYVIVVTALNIQGWLSPEEFVSGFTIISFLVNLPHFAASYQLFYGEHRHRLKTSWRWKLIGIVIPVLLFLFIFVSYMISSWRDVALLVSLMFILVGWHYVQQVFGCMVVTAHRSGYRFEIWQRRALQINLLALWTVTLTENYQRFPFLVYSSLNYPFPAVPASYGVALYVLIGTSALAFLFTTFRKYRREKKKIPFITWVPLAALYFWFLPNRNNMLVILAVPLFHGLQYLLFVMTYKKNQLSETAKKDFLKRMTWFFLIAFLTGGLAMELIPRVLDLFFSLPMTNITIFLVMFNVFINIHHYLIDFVIWRRNVPEFQRYLLDPRL